MIFNLILAHPFLMVGLVVSIFCAAWYRLIYYKPVRYCYPLATFLVGAECAVTRQSQRIMWLSRFLLLVIVALLASRLQQVDVQSKVSVRGIDIMLALDVSGSMQAFDDLKDQRMRIDVAKQEAICFIERRHNDQLGLVLFGKNAVSRCPLTLDKKILTQIIKDVSLGVLDAEGTMLGHGMLIAANRLKDSTASSKVMIVLTDGQPTPGDLPIQEVLDVIKKLGIKVYTIGIGSQEGAYVNHPLVGIVPVQTPLNQELLEQLAQQTGGAAFMASKPQELRAIYETIDALERTEREAPMFSWYHDLFKPLALLALLILAIEWFLATTVWFIL